jgi:type VI secretion system secreted protein VgrG
MALQACKGLDISSTEDEVRITAKKKIVLNVGSNYITLDPYRIEIGSPGEVEIKTPHFDYISSAGRLKAQFVPLAEPLPEEPRRLALNFSDAMAKPIAGAPYTLNFDNGQVLKGKLDERGHAEHLVATDSPARVQYELPEPKPAEPWTLHNRIKATTQREWMSKVGETDRSTRST